MCKISNSKKIAKIVRKEIKKGAKFVKGKKHGKLRFENGRMIVVPCTPSDIRAVKNFICELRRRKSD